MELHHGSLSRRVSVAGRFSVEFRRMGSAQLTRNPLLHLGPHRLKNHPGVPHVILDVLLLVQKPPVPLVQRLGQIPMEQRDHGLDAVRQTFVHEVDVVLQTGLVDGVVAAAQRDDAAPGNAEAVGFGAQRLHERHVVFVAVVGVAGDVAVGAVGNFARDAAEGVPDAVGAAIFVGCAFDLVAGGMLVPESSS